MDPSHTLEAAPEAGDVEVVEIAREQPQPVRRRPARRRRRLAAAACALAATLGVAWRKGRRRLEPGRYADDGHRQLHLETGVMDGVVAGGVQDWVSGGRGPLRTSRGRRRTIPGAMKRRCNETADHKSSTQVAGRHITHTNTHTHTHTHI